MTHTSSIHKLAARRKRTAISCFGLATLLALVPVALYLTFGITGLSLFISVTCWVSTIFLTKQGQKFWKKAQQASQGAKGEDLLACLLEPLLLEGWIIEHNIPLQVWGDADTYLQSPNDRCFVIDAKSHRARVSYDRAQLLFDYGNKIYCNSSMLGKVKGQALALKHLKQVRYVTPILCFTEAHLEKPCFQIKKVHLVELSELLSLLRRLG